MPKTLLGLCLALTLALPAHATFTISQVTETPGDRLSLQPSLSSDGSLVAFTSDADLVPGGNQDGNRELYLDRLPGPLLQVTDTLEASAGRAHLTKTGSHIFFTMNADLTGENPGLARQLFRYNVGSRVIEQLTNLPVGKSVSSISPNRDGTRVAFTSRADVVPGSNEDGNRELFLWTQTGIQQLTNTTEGRTDRTWMSGDGMRIAIDSNADLVGANPNGRFNIFYWDEGAGFTQVTSAERGALGPNISEDGNAIVFEENGEIRLHDIAAGSTRVLTPPVQSGLGSANPTISRTGEYVAFNSVQDLVAGSNSDLSIEWFLMNTRSNEVRQVTNSVGTLNGFFGSLTGDGNTFAFTFDRDLVGENSDENREIFLAQRESACTPGPTTLCLNEDRFKVEVAWERPNGETGAGMAVGLTDDTGYFWFFNPANVEMVIKVLRGCSNNGHYWVFAGGLTNVEVDIFVTDTATGTQNVYTNPLREPFQPIQDTDAFATCP